MRGSIRLGAIEDLNAGSLMGKALDDGSSNMKRQETKKGTRFWQNREFNINHLEDDFL